MGKKSSPRAPTPPDPVATAEAQGKINLEAIQKSAEINQMTVQTPDSKTYYTGEIGTPSRTKNVEWNGNKQAIADSRDRLDLSMTDLAGQSAANLKLPDFKIDRSDVPEFKYNGGGYSNAVGLGGGSAPSYASASIGGGTGLSAPNFTSPNKVNINQSASDFNIQRGDVNQAHSVRNYDDVDRVNLGDKSGLQQVNSADAVNGFQLGDKSGIQDLNYSKYQDGFQLGDKSG
ncbi:MAG TPA: hypothetical protein ENK70_07175, partial [Methylophaga sp.]|nr:hypothetical protein [Methylophaga sp.]